MQVFVLKCIQKCTVIMLCFFPPEQPFKNNQHLSRVIMCERLCMWTLCHSKLFSPTLCFFSALSKSFPPTLLEYLAFGISAYTYLFSHCISAPFTPNNLLFWGPTAALQDLKLLGCSSSQPVLNVLHCQH